MSPHTEKPPDPPDAEANGSPVSVAVTLPDGDGAKVREVVPPRAPDAPEANVAAPLSSDPAAVEAEETPPPTDDAIDKSAVAAVALEPVVATPTPASTAEAGEERAAPKEVAEMTLPDGDGAKVREVVPPRAPDAPEADVAAPLSSDPLEVEAEETSSSTGDAIDKSVVALEPVAATPTPTLTAEAGEERATPKEVAEIAAVVTAEIPPSPSDAVCEGDVAAVAVEPAVAAPAPAPAPAPTEEATEERAAPQKTAEIATAVATKEIPPKGDVAVSAVEPVAMVPTPTPTAKAGEERAAPQKAAAIVAAATSKMAITLRNMLSEEQKRLRWRRAIYSYVVRADAARAKRREWPGKAAAIAAAAYSMMAASLGNIFVKLGKPAADVAEGRRKREEQERARWCRAIYGYTVRADVVRAAAVRAERAERREWTRGIYSHTILAERTRKEQGASSRDRPTGRVRSWTPSTSDLGAERAPGAEEVRSLLEGALLLIVALGPDAGTLLRLAWFLIPAMKSFQALERAEGGAVKLWLYYWVVFSFLAMLGVDTVLVSAGSQVNPRTVHAVAAITYPALKSLQALRAFRSEVSMREIDDLGLWITYWVLQSGFTLTEVVAGAFLPLLPRYDAFKAAVLLWACLPQTRGAEVLCRLLSSGSLASNVSVKSLDDESVPGVYLPAATHHVGAAAIRAVSRALGHKEAQADLSPTNGTKSPNDATCDTVKTDSKPREISAKACKEEEHVEQGCQQLQDGEEAASNWAEQIYSVVVASQSVAAERAEASKWAEQIYSVVVASQSVAAERVEASKWAEKIYSIVVASEASKWAEKIYSVVVASQSVAAERAEASKWAEKIYSVVMAAAGTAEASKWAEHIYSVVVTAAETAEASNWAEQIYSVVVSSQRVAAETAERQQCQEAEKEVEVEEVNLAKEAPVEQHKEACPQDEVVQEKVENGFTEETKEAKNGELENVAAAKQAKETKWSVEAAKWTEMERLKRQKKEEDRRRSEEKEKEEPKEEAAKDQAVKSEGQGTDEEHVSSAQPEPHQKEPELGSNDVEAGAETNQKEQAANEQAAKSGGQGTDNEGVVPVQPEPPQAETKSGNGTPENGKKKKGFHLRRRKHKKKK